MNAKYYADNHRGVTSDFASEAAQIIAERKARALFGKSGQVGACRIDSWSEDGRIHECEAFIGYRSGPAETTGRNVRFIMELR